MRPVLHMRPHVRQECKALDPEYGMQYLRDITPVAQALPKACLGELRYQLPVSDIA